MMITRRNLLAQGAALSVLAGCGGATSGGAPVPAQTGRDPAFRPTANPSYDAWRNDFRARALGRGISAATFDRAFRGQGYLPGVVERDRNQAETGRALVDYLALVAPEEKIPLGRRAMASQRGALDAVAARYGVSANVIAAIWGVESYFGTRKGDIPVISATSTLAWEGRRRAFFESNLLDALRMIQDGDARPEELVGSWAGASGHTQLMPNAFQSFAVDFDGNGRRDVWGSNPIDAFATTANYLKRSGWQTGQPWGLEVTLPQGFDAGIGKRAKRSVAEWRGLGVQAARGSLPSGGSAAILAPMGIGRPAFMVFRNFEVILRYNPSDNYGLGVGYLSDRLAGGGPLVGSFGPDRHGLTLEQRQALQRGLTRAGFDAGTPDGVLGKKTEAAIRAYQQAKGLPVTGTPSPELLRRLG